MILRIMPENFLKNAWIMKANYTHVSMLLDRSGSMDEIKSYIIEGFNDFIKNQKKEPGELSVTLVQFDTEYEVLQDHKSVILIIIGMF